MNIDIKFGKKPLLPFVMNAVTDLRLELRLAALVQQQENNP